MIESCLSKIDPSIPTIKAKVAQARISQIIAMIFSPSVTGYMSP